jgi:hypothetical protein
MRDYVDPEQLNDDWEDKSGDWIDDADPEERRKRYKAWAIKDDEDWDDEEYRDDDDEEKEETDFHDEPLGEIELHDHPPEESATEPVSEPTTEPASEPTTEAEQHISLEDILAARKARHARQKP